MADSSEFGWRLVKEYEAHPIASDEKRIFKAEVRAARKMKSEKSKRGVVATEHGRTDEGGIWSLAAHRLQHRIVLVVLFRDTGRRTDLL